MVKLGIHKKANTAAASETIENQNNERLKRNNNVMKNVMARNKKQAWGSKAVENLVKQSRSLDRLPLLRQNILLLSAKVSVCEKKAQSHSVGRYC